MSIWVDKMIVMFTRKCGDAIKSTGLIMHMRGLSHINGDKLDI